MSKNTKKYDNSADMMIALILCSVIVCSVIFKVYDDVSYFTLLKDYELPITCVFKLFTGYNCPACGMTRSFISIGHADFYNSLRYNIAGIFAYLLCIEEIFYRVLKVLSVGSSRGLVFLRKAVKLQVVLVGAALLVNWLFYWRLLSLII